MDSGSSISAISSQGQAGVVGVEAEEGRHNLQAAQDSFTQPPLTVHLAAIVMALCGGMINAISFMDLGEHTFVSHLSGTTSKIGMRAAGYGTAPTEAQKKSDAEEAASTAYAVLLLVFFMSGSCVSGMLISRNAMSIGRSAYGMVLIISASLLTIAALSDISEGKPIGALAAAMACGIQNGMVSTYSGSVIRTTHVTGTWTDLGLSLGRVLANLLRNGWRAPNTVDRVYLMKDFARCRLMFLLGFGFCSGCFMGAELQGVPALHKKALLIPAAILGFGGLGHAIYVSFVLNVSFFQMLKSSSQNPQARQVMLYIDGEVYDLPTGASLLEASAGYYGSDTCVIPQDISARVFPYLLREPQRAAQAAASLW